MLSGKVFQGLLAKYSKVFRPYEAEAALYNESWSVPMSHLRTHEVSLPWCFFFLCVFKVDGLAPLRAVQCQPTDSLIQLQGRKVEKIAQEDAEKRRPE